MSVFLKIARKIVLFQFFYRIQDLSECVIYATSCRIFPKYQANNIEVKSTTIHIEKGGSINKYDLGDRLEP